MKVVAPAEPKNLPFTKHCPYCGGEMHGYKIENNEYVIRIGLQNGRYSKRKDLEDARYHMCTKCRAKIGKKLDQILDEHMVLCQLNKGKTI